MLVPSLVLLVLASGPVAAWGCVTDADCFAVGGFCDVNRRCDAGQCASDLRNCSDGDPCTDDSCNGQLSVCVHTPVCPNDGLVCNGDETCVGIPGPFGDIAFCPPVFPPNCDDGNACTIDSCAEPSGCQHVDLNCDDGDQCTVDACDPYARQGQSPCSHTPIARCCHTSTDCPSDACGPGVCTAGSCVSGMPATCDDGDPTTADGCDPVTGCTHVPLSQTPCTSASDCPVSPDPCVVISCPQPYCAAQSLDGIAGATCVCERSDPAACTGAELPGKVAAARRRACELIGRAADGGKKAPKYLTKAKKLLGRARRLIGHAKALDGTCRDALGVRITDDVTRLDAAKSALGGMGG